MLDGARSLLVSFLQHKRPLSGEPLSNFERLSREIKAGDVLLVEGRSRVSDVIRWVTKSSWTHAMLYVGRTRDVTDPALLAGIDPDLAGNPDAQLVVESELGLGTLVRALTVYEGEHMRVCRARALSQQSRDKLISHALSRLGTPYNVRQIFDLLRFLFPWFIMPRRWRSTLFEVHAGPSTHTVCSTMIAEAFASIDYPILPLVKRVEGDRVVLYRRNPKLCVPADFDYSPYFDIIKYPYLDLRSYSSLYLAPAAFADGLEKEYAGIYLSPEDQVGAGDGVPREAPA